MGQFMARRRFPRGVFRLGMPDATDSLPETGMPNAAEVAKEKIIARFKRGERGGEIGGLNLDNTRRLLPILWGEVDKAQTADDHGA